VDAECAADHQATKVYLKKHLEQPRTYTINKKDKKMVGSAMAKKL
jgi:predicted ATP-grasp superfamily ATP-dependent carboligase